MAKDSIAQKWFAELQSHLEKMPLGYEILFQEEGFESEHGCNGSSVHLFRKGGIDSSSPDDLATWCPSVDSIDHFDISRVAANNHGY